MRTWPSLFMAPRWLPCRVIVTRMVHGRLFLRVVWVLVLLFYGCSNNRVVGLQFNHFGKANIKQWKISPDGFIQVTAA